MLGEETTKRSLINSWGNALLRLQLGTDIVKARRWIRYGWIAGFTAAGINLVVAIMSLPGNSAQGALPLTQAQFSFVVLDGAVLALLSYGVLRRGRMAGVLLFAYFVISKLVVLSLGMASSSFPLQLVFAIFFYRAMRAVLTFHYLTHPNYSPESGGPGEDSGSPR